MAIQLSTLVRNAMLDAMETQIGTSAKIEIYTGSPPASCAASATGTKLAEFALASDWAGNAASGSKAFNSISPTTGLAAGTAGYYRLTASDGTTTGEQGTITVTGGGGDMTIDNATIAIGQTINVTGWSWTEPGA